MWCVAAQISPYTYEQGDLICYLYMYKVAIRKKPLKYKITNTTNSFEAWRSTFHTGICVISSYTPLDICLLTDARTRYHNSGWYNSVSSCYITFFSPKFNSHQDLAWKGRFLSVLCDFVFYHCIYSPFLATVLRETFCFTGAYFNHIGLLRLHIVRAIFSLSIVGFLEWYQRCHTKRVWFIGMVWYSWVHINFLKIAYHINYRRFHVVIGFAHYQCISPGWYLSQSNPYPPAWEV